MKLIKGDISVLSRFSVSVLFFVVVSMAFGMVSADSYDAYNLELEVPSDYNSVFPGDEVWFTSKVLNLANRNRVDIILSYSLLDPAGVSVFSRSETVAIETQASFVGSINIPLDSKGGDYILRVVVDSGSGNETISLKNIHVIEPKGFFEENSFLLSVFGIFLLVFLFFLWFIPFVRRLNHSRILRFNVLKVIRTKVKKGAVSKEDLNNSKLPSNNVSSSLKSKEKVF